jgi:hypothetical protein
MSSERFEQECWARGAAVTDDTGESAANDRLAVKDLARLLPYPWPPHRDRRPAIVFPFLTPCSTSS